MTITNAQLAQQVLDMVTARITYDTEHHEWLTGVVGGGPASDGKYILTNPITAVSRPTTCPAQLEANVQGLVDSSSAHAAAALTSATNAATEATNAATEATNAETSRLASEAAQGLAESAKTTAQTASAIAVAQSNNVVTLHGQVAASEANCLTSESNCAASEANCLTSESAAAASAMASADSALAAQINWETFNDIFLGSKTSDPILANDGGALINGAIYWNTVSSRMRVYNGSAWEDVYAGQNNADTVDGYDSLELFDRENHTGLQPFNSMKDFSLGPNTSNPGLSITMQPGKIFSGGSLISSNYVTLVLPAPATHPRITRIALDMTTGLIAVLHGVEAASPVAPDYLVNHIPIGQVILFPSTTVITDLLITDERVPLIRQATIYHGRVNQIGTVVSGNSGFTVSRTVTGTYSITHNLNHLNYSVVATGKQAVSVTQVTNTSFVAELRTLSTTGGVGETLVDDDWQFMLMVD